jgi:hypothetical protein
LSCPARQGSEAGGGTACRGRNEWRDGWEEPRVRYPMPERKTGREARAAAACSVG